MPWRNEADRLIRESARARKQATKDAVRADRERQQQASRAIQDEIPVVLGLLAQRGYPERKEVSLGRGKGLRRNPVAAWEIGSYTYPAGNDNDATATIYLVSDGRIGIQHHYNGKVDIQSVRELLRVGLIAPNVTKVFMIHEGLVALHQRLDPSYQPPQAK